MKIGVGSGRTTGEIIVRFFTKDDRAGIPGALTEHEFSAKPNSLIHLHHEKQLCVGLGEAEKVTAQTVRSATGTAVMFLRRIGRSSATLDLRDWPRLCGAAVEGAILANYRFEKFKPASTKPVTGLRIQVGPGALAAARRAAKHAEAIANAANYAREIANLPGNVIYPASLAKEAKRMARERGLGCTVLDERALAAGKFGGLLAVGSGSIHPPCLIVLDHRGGPKGQRPVALVGKAVTFDSGGISIKPAAQMEEMIFDKCGGIAVLGAMAAISATGLKRNVIGVIASAENMPGASAYRPGDIVTTWDGKHIEINNTDAEGRVVLADAIAYARKDRRASAIVDLATLTGACGIALGEAAAGLWSTSDGLRDQIVTAAEGTGERVWPMPLFPEYDDQIKSQVALVKNSAGRLAGASTGAAFLKVFAEETPWAHLDVAYTVSRDKDRSDMARGATGYGVRLLTALLENWRDLK